MKTPNNLWWFKFPEGNSIWSGAESVGVWTFVWPVHFSCSETVFFFSCRTTTTTRKKGDKNPPDLWFSSGVCSWFAWGKDLQKSLGQSRAVPRCQRRETCRRLSAEWREIPPPLSAARNKTQQVIIPLNDSLILFISINLCWKTRL